MSRPIDSRYRAQMNEIAQHLDAAFNGNTKPRRIGFALFLFEFGKVEGGRVNYISNAERAEMLTAVREWLARAEGRAHDAPEQKQ